MSAPASSPPPIVILTGAGISRDSGLDTFRCAGGIWSQVRLEDVATPDGFRRDPARVHAFYNARRAQLADPAIQPNAAHHALARLEQDYPGEVLLVTQNIDDLHQRAGSRCVLPMHGELRKIRCDACATVLPWDHDCSPAVACPACGIAGALRPHVVWFGEMPLEMDRIYAALDDCGLFLSIGTSGTVYPAAGFVSHLSDLGMAHTLELNLAPSEGASLFDDGLYGPASEVVPAVVDRILRGDIPGW
ncbi:Sir2 family NAD+-dependent deacetylase [Novispirillum itersonii]|uniref:NAD-dependent protein deacylase n=1 Tax=Novispirillum itersonii TaxID=189 RepID=A0A7W9ZE75_NOVIT|nr:Sir2 family NAD+-dependent deacetylase [Novispirillum itersonii]MBB6209873.1 NAD-dependent deacetylase [Novispirillum itersonii]